jgi:hypothetical protein
MSETNNETVNEDGTDTTTTVANLQSQLDKVNERNRLLISEKQQAKQDAQTARDQADDAATEAAAKSGDIEALKTAHKRELDKLQLKMDATDGELRTIRVDNAIQQAITQGNVKPEYAKAVTAMMKGDVTYQDGIATIEGQPIADYMSTYLGSKDGAHFVRAADNSGSSATGSDGTKATTPWTKADVMGKRSNELQQIARDNPAQYASIMASVGLAKS